MPGLVGMDSIEPVIKDENAEDDDFFKPEPEEHDDGLYKPRPQLPGVYPCMRDLDWLFKCLESGAIDVDPEYQREVVWTADRMTGLVDSLMENYYIPPIILNKKTQRASDGSATNVYVCVDGKQRLTSVRAFIKGMIPCHDHRGNKWWFEDGIRRKGLPENVRKEFLSKEFVSFEYRDLTRAQEEDLFARVQMGMSLTLAEKMHAQSGPWQELARVYVEDFPMVFSLLKDQSRAKPFQLCLSCFSQILEVQHPSSANGTPILKTNFAALPKLLKNKDAVDDETKSHLASVFRTFNDLVTEDHTVFTEMDRGVQTFSPLEVVAVAVLISMYSETRNNKLLLGDIRLLRTELRDSYNDLRLNTTLWGFTWKFLENLEAYRGAVDGSTINRNANARVPSPKASGASIIRSPQRAGISLRAAGSRRGRPTMRTQPSRVVVESSPDPPSRKRPRLDDGPQHVFQASTPSPTVPPTSKPQAPSSTSTNARQIATDPPASLIEHPNSRKPTNARSTTSSIPIGTPRPPQLPGTDSSLPRQSSDQTFIDPSVSRADITSQVLRWNPVNAPNRFRAPVAPMMASMASSTVSNQPTPGFMLPIHYGSDSIQRPVYPQNYNQWDPRLHPSNAERRHSTTAQGQLFDTVGAALSAQLAQDQARSQVAPPAAKKTPVVSSDASRNPVVQPPTAHSMPDASQSPPGPTRSHAPTTSRSPTTTAQDTASPSLLTRQQYHPQPPPGRTLSTTTFGKRPNSSKFSNSKISGAASSPFSIDGAMDREIVDLTSDTEQERQDLLSNFKGPSKKPKERTRSVAVERAKTMAARWDSVNRRMSSDRNVGADSSAADRRLDDLSSQASTYSTDSEMPLLPIRPRGTYVRKRK